MVDFAEAKTVLDYRKAVLLVVADDVGSIEELAMPEAADGALCLIGEEDASSEFRLMEALFQDSFGVFALAGLSCSGLETKRRLSSRARINRRLSASSATA